MLLLWGFFSSFAKCFCLSDEDSDSYSPRYSYSENSKWFTFLVLSVKQKGHVKHVFICLLSSSPIFLYFTLPTGRTQLSVPRSKSEMDNIDSEKVVKRSATLPLPNRTSSLKSSPERWPELRYLWISTGRIPESCEWEGNKGGNFGSTQLQLNFFGELEM